MHSNKNKNKYSNIASWLAKDNITKAYYFELSNNNL